MKPYLQIGRAPQSLSLMWFTADEDAVWTVSAGTATVRADARRVVIGGSASRQVVAVLPVMPPSTAFEYRVLADGQAVFRARAVSPPGRRVGYHAVLFGDAADGSGSERAIAAAVYADRPELVLIAGDIAYPHGTQADYIHNVFPVYNADHAVAGVGFPLMRSVPFVAAPGNHDIPALSNLPINFNKLPDALAYFYDWLQPLNGPAALGPPLSGPSDTFRQAAGSNFPRMASFSFDWGDSHWLVLDSNPYNDWSDAALERWVSADLAAAKSAGWRFVLFHHAPFHSSKAHADNQWMRVLSPVFERGRVDVVFAGHVHNYERTWPLKFQPVPGPGGRLIAADGKVAGTPVLDRTYDGIKNTRPQGILYVVSGAGGAPLYQASTPRDYSCRYLADVWSFTDLRVDGDTLVVRQLGIDGKELDRFSVTR